jgi:ribosomal protein S11
MKWAGLTLFVLIFPLTVWIFQGYSVVRNTQQKTTPTTAISKPPKSQEKKPSTAKTLEIDLAEASSTTMRKIKDIDNKIDAAKTELQQTQAARQTVIRDLIKIQAKIDSLVKADPQL